MESINRFIYDYIVNRVCLTETFENNKSIKSNIYHRELDLKNLNKKY